MQTWFLSMTNPLDEAVDKLIAEKQDKMARVMELSQLLFVGVARERGFVAGLAKKHSGWQLSRAMLAVYHMHRSLSEHGNGLVRWDSALARELSNGKLEETTEPKPKRSDAQETALYMLRNLGYKTGEVVGFIESSEQDDGGQIVASVLKQLGAERKAS